MSVGGKTCVFSDEKPLTIFFFNAKIFLWLPSLMPSFLFKKILCRISRIPRRIQFSISSSSQWQWHKLSRAALGTGAGQDSFLCPGSLTRICPDLN